MKMETPLATESEVGLNSRSRVRLTCSDLSLNVRQYQPSIFTRSR